MRVRLQKAPMKFDIGSMIEFRSNQTLAIIVDKQSDRIDTYYTLYFIDRESFDSLWSDIMIRRFTTVIE